MLILGYCFGIRSERRLCDEVNMNLAYRWFCKLGLEGPVPNHSTFSTLDMDGFKTATFCGRSLKTWSPLAWRKALSQAKPLQRMQASSKRMLGRRTAFSLLKKMPNLLPRTSRAKGILTLWMMQPLELPQTSQRNACPRQTQPRSGRQAGTDLQVLLTPPII